MSTIRDERKTEIDVSTDAAVVVVKSRNCIMI